MLIHSKSHQNSSLNRIHTKCMHNDDKKNPRRFLFIFIQATKIEITASFALFSVLHHIFPFINPEEQNNLSFFMFMMRFFLCFFFHGNNNKHRQKEIVNELMDSSLRSLSLPLAHHRRVIVSVSVFTHSNLTLTHYARLDTHKCTQNTIYFNKW